MANRRKHHHKPIQYYRIQELLDAGFEVTIQEHSERSRDYGHARVKQLGLKVSSVYQLSEGRVSVSGKIKGVSVTVFTYGEGGR